MEDKKTKCGGAIAEIRQVLAEVIDEAETRDARIGDIEGILHDRAVNTETGEEVGSLMDRVYDLETQHEETLLNREDVNQDLLSLRDAVVELEKSVDITDDCHSKLVDRVDHIQCDIFTINAETKAFRAEVEKKFNAHIKQEQDILSALNSRMDMVGTCNAQQHSEFDQRISSFSKAIIASEAESRRLLYEELLSVRSLIVSSAIVAILGACALMATGLAIYWSFHK